MQHNDNTPKRRRRRRTKQTLKAPRRIGQNAERELQKLVWVTVGKTEHQAWLLEDVNDRNTVLIQWETTGSEERVSALSIRHEAPEDGRRSRRRRTSVINSLEGLESNSIQIPRKRKRRQNKKEVTTKSENITLQNKEMKRNEALGAKLESKRLKGGLSAFLDTKSASTFDVISSNDRAGKKSQEKVLPGTYDFFTKSKMLPSGAGKAKDCSIIPATRQNEKSIGDQGIAAGAAATSALTSEIGQTSKTIESSTAGLESDRQSDSDDDEGYFI